jgi:hypothetical protein
VPTTRRSVHRLQTKGKVRYSREHLRDIFRVTGPSYDVTDLLKVQVGRSRPVSRGTHPAYSRFSPSLKEGKSQREKESAKRRKAARPPPCPLPGSGSERGCLPVSVRVVTLADEGVQSMGKQVSPQLQAGPMKTLTSGPRRRRP